MWCIESASGKRYTVDGGWNEHVGQAPWLFESEATAWQYAEDAFRWCERITLDDVRARVNVVPYVDSDR